MVKILLTKTQPIDSQSLLYTILSRYYGLPMPAFATNEHGKPYLTNAPYFFSLAHSGTLTAVAVSEKEVGLDVEKRTEKNYPAVVSRLTEREKTEDFFTVWTAKEAYVKLRGFSLASELKELCFYDNVLYRKGIPVAAALSHFQWEDYQFCLCTQTEEPFEMIFLDE